jgi:hypothetical protein
MATSRDLVQISGENPLLVERLSAPLQQALADRQRYYRVNVERVGRVGEVLISITGTKGHMPLLFGEEELEPGYVCRVVQDTVSRFGF